MKNAGLAGIFFAFNERRYAALWSRQVFTASASSARIPRSCAFMRADKALPLRERLPKCGSRPEANSSTVRANIGFLTDQFGLYERLSTREYLAYFGELHGMGGKALSARMKAHDLGMRAAETDAVKT